MNSSPWSRRVPPRPPKSTHASQPPTPPPAPPGRENPPAPGPPPIGLGRSLLDTQTAQAVRPPRATNKSNISAKRKKGMVVAVGSLVVAAGATTGLMLLQSETGNESVDGALASTTTNTTSNGSLTPVAGTANWDELARSVVFITAGSPCNWRGSGTLVLDGSFVLTNEHVSSDGRCRLTIGLTKDLSSEPTGDLTAIVVARSVEDDLAVLRLIDSNGEPYIPVGHRPVSIDYQQPPLGAKLTTLGYPALGAFDSGLTITFTGGDFAGIDNTFGEFYKTTAQMRGGVSGGAAFTDNGLFIGVPTGGFLDEETGEDVGINLIRPAKYAKELLEAARRQSLTPVDPDTEGAPSPSYGNDMNSTDPRFNTCKEAKANGYGPYYIGFDPEYDWYRDADSDGVVCE
jgi:hypothetical protein